MMKTFIEKFQRWTLFAGLATCFSPSLEGEKPEGPGTSEGQKLTSPGQAFSHPSLVLRNIAFYRAGSAHLIHDRTRDTWSAIFFEAQTVEGPPPLIVVDGPCLILFQWEDPDRLNLSVSDPDLDLSIFPMTSAAPET